MKVNKLLNLHSDIEIEGISSNSKDVKLGDAYFCLSDDKEKAEEYCLEALSKGVSAVFSSFDFENTTKLDDIRSAFANACANFYDRACDKMKLIAVTGTNGKTSVSHILGQMLERNDKKVGIIGTNGVFYAGKNFDCPLTTPDADFLHKTFFDMQKAGVEYVIMEVSAHAIDQKRVEGLKFEVAILTNITQDHLDYFKTFENYKNTKLSFFNKNNVKKAVVFVDDENCCEFVKNCEVPVLTYGVENPADCFAVDIFCSLQGTHFYANICDNFLEVNTNLIGKFNCLNALACLCTGYLLGFEPEKFAQGLQFVNLVEGRFNVINFSGKHVVIDFAHSPDGLEKVIETARELTEKRVLVVFGCGGNRDVKKRAIMGKIAEENADVVILTDDNPRTEKSLDIISDIEKGMKKSHFVETDRKEAIRLALNLAKEGDIVVVAGKGAEKFQEIGTTKRKYNDFDAIYAIFQETNPIKQRGKEIYD